MLSQTRVQIIFCFVLSLKDPNYILFDVQSNGFLYLSVSNGGICMHFYLTNSNNCY